MELRRDTWQAIIRFAAMLSVASASIAIVLDLVGDVSALALVAVVAVVGFSTSWALAGRDAAPAAVPRRRSAPVRQPTG